MKTDKGLTLIELMVTLGVLAIMLAVLSPNVSQLGSRNKSVSAVNRLSGDIAFARNEAVTRNALVSVVAKGGDWANGWLITTGATTLRDVPALPSTITVTAATFGFNFSANGAQNAGTFTIKLCDNARPAGNHGSIVEVISSGRHSLLKDVACP